MLTIDNGVEDVFAISIDQVVDVAKDSTVIDEISIVYDMAVSFFGLPHGCEGYLSGGVAL